MLNIIINNAFRLIGTPANAKIKERLANISKIKAYSRIGKEVSFPLDLSKVLKKPNRNPEILQQATSQLNIQKEFLKHSLFWFYQLTPEQEEATEFLSKNDFKSAEKIYRKGTDFSSIISYSTFLFIQKRDSQALKLLNRLVQKPELKTAFTDFVSNNTGQVIELTSDELLEIILDGILESYQPYNLLKLYTSLNKSEKIPFFDNIKKIIDQKNSEILIKKVESTSKNLEVQLKTNVTNVFYSADKLIETAKTDLRYLEKSMGVTTEVKNTADGFVTAILACIVKFFNDTDEPSINTMKKTLNYIRKIKNLAYSERLILECQRNIDSMNKILSIVDDDDDFFF